MKAGSECLMFVMPEFPNPASSDFLPEVLPRQRWIPAQRTAGMTDLINHALYEQIPSNLTELMPFSLQ
jgi:hypothetical protein